ncbi:Type 4 prepilin-like proteins leader peptide-processing enzyme [Marinobacterium sp. xm-d-579]|uniref:prepilin peptidase n=1 Tax=Marinobacterium sp. xm-d-579 TaxID=2497734 RepID=UPI001567E364|nr:A24 family peptidase [Marinobacterium sp. xm-d-579]NRP37000.1 Type 4 prepilin-like proteins leader peptide-processing enzyme [Marinobacterium sp. xm-d-579]
MSAYLSTLESIYLPAVVMFSLLVGSFLNVVIHRLPIMMMNSWRREAAEFLDQQEISDDQPISLSQPRSRCPQCGHAIRWYENILILSYLLILKGRCSGCASSISMRYPMIEGLTAVVGLTIALYFGFTLQMLVMLFVSYSLIVLIFIDADHQLLPDQITLPLLWAGLLVNLVFGWVPLDSAVTGAMLGYLVLWLVFWLFKLVTGKEGMGYGDFKLLSALGAWGGYAILPGIILISSVAGVIYALVGALFGRQDLTKPMPFGPFLALAGWLMLIWGDQINQWYLSLLL